MNRLLLIPLAIPVIAFHTFMLLDSIDNYKTNGFFYLIIQISLALVQLFILCWLWGVGV